ncbi:MAG: hypothetical protein LBD71_03010, partial [Treponema sp.]|jgi:hypothetical protein|nr:hypothetical protein [Treponema sp.]
VKIEEKDGDLLATATDGRRLHRARAEGKADGLSPGYWRVLKNGTEKDRDYDTESEIGYAGRRVYMKRKILWLAKLESFSFFPQDDVLANLFPKGDPVKEGVVDAHKYECGGLNRFIKDLPGAAGINPAFLNDLGPYEWKYKFYSPDKPIVFEHGDMTALIMPLNPV